MALLLETYKSSVDNPFAVEPPENAENPSVYNEEAPSNPLYPAPPPPPPAAAPRVPVLPLRRPRALPGWTLESTRQIGSNPYKIDEDLLARMERRRKSIAQEEEDEWSE